MWTHPQDVNVCPSQTGRASQCGPDGQCAELLEAEEEQKAAEGGGRQMHLLSGFCSVCLLFAVDHLLLWFLLSVAEAHSRKRWLFYTQVWAVGMPGILLAFLTPDSDKRKCRKLPLLKPCLLDTGHPCDTAASMATLSQKHGTLLSLSSGKKNHASHVAWLLAGSELLELEISHQLGKKKKNPWTHEVQTGRLCSWADHQREHWDTLWLFKVAALSIIQCREHPQSSEKYKYKKNIKLRQNDQF